MLLDALPVIRHPARDLPDALRNVVEALMWDLLDGCAYLEIDYLRSVGASPSSAPTAFQLHVIPAASVVVRRGEYTQRVTSPTAGERASTSQVPLERDHIVEITPPPQLAHELRKTRSIINELDAYSFTTQQALFSQDGFDLDRYDTLRADVALRETRAIGWGAGEAFTGLLGPARAWRALQFERTRIKLRETILDGLREAIGRAAQHTGIAMTFTLQRVLQLSDIDVMEQALHDGTRPLSELRNPRFRPHDAQPEQQDSSRLPPPPEG